MSLHKTYMCTGGPRPSSLNLPTDASNQTIIKNQPNNNQANNNQPTNNNQQNNQSQQQQPTKQ